MARPGRMRTAAAIAAPVAVVVALTWFVRTAIRPDYPETPAVAVDGQDAPAVDLASVQRSWPSGIDDRLEKARLRGFMRNIEAAPVVAAPVPAKLAPAPELDLGTRLARAVSDKGRAATRVCAACHSFEQGGPNRVGPNLWGVVGRKIGSHPGFAYSKAVASHPGAWTYTELDQYLASPARAVPGNKMAFAGIRNAQDRANVIAYLGTLSARPLPYPVPQPAGAGGEAPRPAKS
jgi:cytochrome c